jgi:hypothetical protein
MWGINAIKMIASQNCLQFPLEVKDGVHDHHLLRVSNNFALFPHLLGQCTGPIHGHPIEILNPFINHLAHFLFMCKPFNELTYRIFHFLIGTLSNVLPA